MALCPAGVDIPGYFSLVNEGRCADAVRLIRKDNPFPTACAYICEHPCEARCRRNMVDDAINNMMQILPQNELEESDLNRTYNKETEINNFRNVLRITNIEIVNAKKYEYQDGTFYMDLVEEAEKLGEYIVNVVEALKEKRKVSK